MAVIHEVFIDNLIKEAEGFIDWLEYENVRDIHCKKIRDEYSKHMTQIILRSNPNIVNYAKHGDILIDSTQDGYRSNGIFFIKTKPQFSIILKGKRLDSYGNVPEDFGMLTDFKDTEHWSLDKMNICITYNEDGKISYENSDYVIFDWHTDNNKPQGYFGKDVIKNGKFTIDNNRIILEYKNVKYLVNEYNCYYEITKDDFPLKSYTSLSIL